MHQLPTSMQHVAYVKSTGRVYPKPNLRIKYQQATIKHIHTIPNFLTLVMELMRQEIKKSRGEDQPGCLRDSAGHGGEGRRGGKSAVTVGPPADQQAAVERPASPGVVSL